MPIFHHHVRFVLLLMVSLWVWGTALPLRVLAQAPSYAVLELTTEEGLPSNLVKDAVFDAQGFIWIATDGGLARFDGVEIKIYENETGQFEPYAKSLHPLPTGEVLVAFDTGYRVMAFDGQRIVTVATLGLPGTDFGKLVFQDRRGVTWLANERHILLQRDSTIETLRFPQEASSNSLIRSFHIAEREDGTFFISANPGRLYRWRPGMPEPEEITPIGSPLAREFHGLLILPDGTLLAGDLRGMHKLEIVGSQYRKVRSWVSPNASSFIEMPWGTLVGNENGVFGLDLAQSNTLQRVGPEVSLAVLKLRSGPRGQVLVSSDNGVRLLYPRLFEEVASFVHTSIQSLSAFGNGIVVLAAEEIWYYESIPTGGFRRRRLSAPIQGVASLTVANDLIWVSTGAGMVHAITAQGRRIHSIQLPVYGIAASIAYCEGRVWVGYWEHPHAYAIAPDGTLSKLGEREGLDGNPTAMRCLDGALYVALIDHPAPIRVLRNGRFEAVPLPANAPSSWAIHDLLKLRDGALLVGSEEGLWRLHRGVLTQVGQGNEQGSEFIRALHADRDGLGVWAGTNLGVMYLRDSTNVLFRRSEGLPNPTIGNRSLVLDANGHLWASHFGGLVRLSPDYVMHKTPAPYLRTQPSLGEGNLAYGSTLLIHARSPAYPAGHVVYQYRINGEDWKNAPRFIPISLPELKRGRYVVEVRARRGGLAWSEVSTLNFQVAPPWYLAPLFLLVAITGFLFTLILGVQATRNLYGRLQAEKTLREQARVLQRTTEELRGTVSELEVARQDAEQASLAKGRFLANMSHELRTPLNGIVGMASLLADSSIDDEQREYVSIIQTSSRSLLDLIGELLDLSRLEANQVSILPEQVDVLTILEEVLDVVSSTAAEKGLLLYHEVATPIPQTALFDRNRVKQILINLVGNAVKFTQAGKVFVRLSAIPREDTRVTLRFEVHDTGIGIAPDVIPRLFQMFEQGDPSTTRRFGGTGLGLAISLRLAELMEGTLAVSSIPGQGSMFSFELPVVENASEPGETAPLSGIRVSVQVDVPEEKAALEGRLSLLGADVVDEDPGADGVLLKGSDDPDSHLVAHRKRVVWVCGIGSGRKMISSPTDLVVFKPVKTAVLVERIRLAALAVEVPVEGAREPGSPLTAFTACVVGDDRVGVRLIERQLHRLGITDVLVKPPEYLHEIPNDARVLILGMSENALSEYTPLVQALIDAREGWVAVYQPERHSRVQYSFVEHWLAKPLSAIAIQVYLEDLKDWRMRRGLP